MAADACTLMRPSSGDPPLILVKVVPRPGALNAVPADLVSCHTAEVQGYVVEGHVPAVAIQRLLRDKLKASGLAVPGMPVGSPGMEGGAPETYEVVLFSPHGQRTFGRYKGSREI
jgi:hypothetical protein